MFMVVGAKTTGTLFLGRSSLPLFSPPQLTFITGLDSQVTAGDVIADLRRRHLIPNRSSSRVQHFIHFPTCQYHRGPLELHERLVDVGVRHQSTVFLKGKCVLGGALNSSSRSHF